MKKILFAALLIPILACYSCKKKKYCYTCTVTVTLRDQAYAQGTTTSSTQDYCDKTQDEIINVQKQGTTTTYSYSGTHVFENKMVTTCKQN